MRAGVAFGAALGSGVESVDPGACGANGLAVTVNAGGGIGTGLAVQAGDGGQ